MAAQYITLEEAAQRLGLAPDDFKRRLKTEWTHVVPMRDGSTLRFRTNQIDELARQLGAASDPELSLAEIEEESAEHGSDDFQIASPKKPAPAKPADEPFLFDSSDDDIFSLSADEPPPPAPKKSGDPDSGVPLGVKGGTGKKANPEAVPTEEIALDLAGPSSAIIRGGSSAKLSAPQSSSKLSAGGDSGKNLGGGGDTGDSSEFELSLDADSDDFELQLNTDSSDEVDLGSSPVDDDGLAGKSGINLHHPGDSGVSLEKGKKGDSARNLAGRSDSGRNLGSKKSDSGRGLAGKPDSGRKPATPPESLEDSDDFELSLEPDSGLSNPKLSGPPSGKIPITSDSDSEFELTLDDSSEGSSLEAAALEEDQSKGDIFETDFEILPMTDESGSEAVALDSDTDLETAPDMEFDDEDLVAEEETGSQVVVLEDEEEGALEYDGVQSLVDDGDVDLADVELEDEDSGSASAVMRGVKNRRHEDEEEEEVLVPGAMAKPAPWGPLPALILFPMLIVLLLGGLMGYELVHTMMGYQQPRKPTAPLVRAIAKSLDMDLKDQ